MLMSLWPHFWAHPVDNVQSLSYYRKLTLEISTVNTKLSQMHMQHNSHLTCSTLGQDPF